MKRLSDFFSLASGVFAVIPGITVLISSLGVPPDVSKNLFAATIEALGVLTLLILWLNKKWIKSRSSAAITKMAIMAIVVFLVALFTYLFLYGYFVVEVPHSDPLFFPLWTQGELNSGLLKFNSREILIEEWGRDDVYKVIRSTSKTPLLITTLIFLFIYQLVFVSLTFSFGVLGIKSSK
jgi:lysylphosphatidylglycerol synthetase-like protein (DUF2156 family)